ncbi:hypothetical protein H0H81_001008 [Sphagnurus paluster]|uniref:Conserved oligomeric Golgi complex subunit 8 n=1 Tax=Sphagnurus paluster TaxID=117069 RepID=A0A9P7GN62_9AGAR|nr:hypothetical protein H0H81_001008 [Sphagnurus paluster]
MDAAAERKVVKERPQSCTSARESLFWGVWMDMESYRTELTTRTLEDLVAEPAALQTQAHHLTSSLTSLTHTSYPTFLQLHQSTTALSHSLASLSTSLSSLISTSLPALQDATATWSTRTTAVLAERSKARHVLDQHDKLRDLLDIPLFIDSCVRNGYFQEALALAAHVAALASRPGTPRILASVNAEVDAAIAQMLAVLLATLHEPGRKLPALWKAVNFLRKMDAFGPSKERTALLGPEDPESAEELLALAFLSGRLQCLATALEPTLRDINRLVGSAPEDGDDGSSQLSDRDKEDIARYLKKYIDVWREGAYDILTQYSTIFLEPQHAHSPLPPKSPCTPRRSLTSLPSSSSSSTLSPSASTQSQSIHPPAPPTLLPYLAPHLLASLLPLLTNTLPRLPLPLLPALLTQLTYCAAAFTRVGLDFRAPVAHAAANAVRAAVARGLREAGGVGDYVPTSMSASVSGSGSGPSSADAGKQKQVEWTKRRPSEWLITPAHLEALLSAPPASTSTLTSVTTNPPHIPPTSLTSFPPLARYTNALLGVLNALRLLAPRAVLPDAQASLDGVLVRAGAELGGYLRPWAVGVRVDGEGEGDVEARREDVAARAVGDAYFGVLVPFMRRALGEGVFGVVALGESEELALARRGWEGAGVV